MQWGSCYREESLGCVEAPDPAGAMGGLSPEPAPHESARLSVCRMPSLKVSREEVLIRENASAWCLKNIKELFAWRQ